jgi:hypothetical protein
MERILFTIAWKKYQIPRSKLNEVCEWLQNPEERDWGRWQKVERSPVLLDWYNQYSENVYTTKSNLHD